MRGPEYAYNNKTAHALARLLVVYQDNHYFHSFIHSFMQTNCIDTLCIHVARPREGESKLIQQ